MAKFYGLQFRPVKFQPAENERVTFRVQTEFAITDEDGAAITNEAGMEIEADSAEQAAAPDPDPEVGYALRWYGAGVADQSFSDAQVLQYQSEGMLDGDMLALVSSCTVEVSGNKLIFNNGTGSAGLTAQPDSRSAAVLGKTVIAELNDPNDNAGAYIGHGYLTGSSQFANVWGAHFNNVGQFFVSDNTTTFPSGGLPPVVLANVTEKYIAVLGGFDSNDVSAAPWDGVSAGHQYGLFVFRTVNGALQLDYVRAQLDVNTYTNDQGVKVGDSRYGANDPLEVISLAEPDIPLPSLLTPLAMDTFNRSDRDLDGDTSDSGHVWEVFNAQNNPPVIEGNRLKQLGGGSTGVERPGAVVEVGITDVVMRLFMEERSDGYQVGIHMVVARYIDVNNYLLGASIGLYEIVAGSQNQLASSTSTATLSCPGVFIVDGQDITWIDGDSHVTTYSGVSNTTGTKVGLRAGLGQPEHCYLDNFSVYPRRSTAQYDDVIQPYIDNLGVVAGSNPAAP